MVTSQQESKTAKQRPLALAEIQLCEALQIPVQHLEDLVDILHAPTTDRGALGKCQPVVCTNIRKL